MSSAATAVSPAARLRGLKPDWISDPKAWRTEVLAGLVVALALIPEAISFSIIAGSTRRSACSPRSPWPW